MEIVPPPVLLSLHRTSTGRNHVTSPRTLRNFIGGAYADSGDAATSDVVNPATG